MELGGKKVGVNTHLVNLPGLEGKQEAALVWRAKGPELALWREEQNNWVLVTHCGEREGRGGLFGRLLGGSLFMSMEAWRGG